MTTQNRLDEIRERLEKATPGCFGWDALISNAPSDIQFLVDLCRRQQAAIDECNKWRALAEEMAGSLDHGHGLTPSGTFVGGCKMCGALQKFEQAVKEK